MATHRSTAAEHEDPCKVSAQVPFEVLYDRHVRSVYRYALSRLRDQQAAEDVTSEVFLRAWRGFERFRGDTPAAWLIVIARNAVADATRARRLSVLPADQAAGVVDRRRLPDEAAVAADEREALRAAVAELSEEQRAVIELQLAGWDGPEIAEALGKSQAAVRMLRRRALLRLRELLVTHKENFHG